MELTKRELAKLLALVGYTSANDMQGILLNSQTSRKFLKQDHRIIKSGWEMDELYEKLRIMYDYEK